MEAIDTLHERGECWSLAVAGRDRNSEIDQKAPKSSEILISGNEDSTVVESAYHIKKPQIGRKMTEETSSIDPVWILRSLERAVDHYRSASRSWQKQPFFQNFNTGRKQLRVRFHMPSERPAVVLPRVAEVCRGLPRVPSADLGRPRQPWVTPLERYALVVRGLITTRWVL